MNEERDEKLFNAFEEITKYFKDKEKKHILNIMADDCNASILFTGYHANREEVEKKDYLQDIAKRYPESRINIKNQNDAYSKLMHIKVYGIDLTIVNDTGYAIQYSQYYYGYFPEWAKQKENGNN